MAALLLHFLLPDKQILDADTGSMGPYPILLAVFLAASLLAASIQAACPPIRPWACHHAPLMAGAIGVLGIWDLLTQKLA